MIPLLLTSLSFGAGTDDSAESNVPQFVVQITVFSGDPLGSNEDGNLEILSRPMLTLLNNQSGTIQIGQLDKGQGTASTEKMKSEFAVSITPELRVDKSIHLNYAIAFVIWEKPNLKKTTGIETTIKMKEGKNQRFRISADTPTDQKWIEISVREIPHTR